MRFGAARYGGSDASHGTTRAVSPTPPIVHGASSRHEFALERPVAPHSIGSDLSVRAAGRSWLSLRLRTRLAGTLGAMAEP